MVENLSRKLTSIFVFGLFAAVIPLLFFPNHWGIALTWSFWEIAALEMGLYFVVWWLVFTQPRIGSSLVLAFNTALLRWVCALMFGLLVFLFTGGNLWVGIQKGLSGYFPALTIQALGAIVIMKLIWLDKRPVRRSRVIHPRENLFAPGAGGHREPVGELAHGNWEDLLTYVKDYNGVEASLLVDQEGLVIACKADQYFDPEVFAPLVGLMEDSSLKILHRIAENQIDRIDTFTPRTRISVHKVLDFRLVVVADRGTDDLINLRIQRAVEQLTKLFSEKYPQDVLINREEEHVRNT